MANGRTTNDKIYELVDRSRLELKGDIVRVDVKVEMLAAEVGKLKEKEATLATKIYVVVGIITTTASALIYALFQRVFR